MSIFMYQAADLFDWLIGKENIVILDVRNATDFNRFKVESPFPFTMLNVSYYDFMEIETESVAKVPRDRPVRIVCAKEGSAKYVAEILDKNGFENVGYLAGGIKSWGNLLAPRLINPGAAYQLYQFIRPGKASCSYGLVSGESIMFFDPSRAVDFYLGFAADKGCKVIKTFETHLQADYIAGSRMISAQSGAEFLANEGDFKGSKNKYIPLKDGEIHCFPHGGPQVRVMFTPGHTPGSTSFIIDEKYWISGDMVFIKSIGRPDLGGMAEAWSKLLFDTLCMVRAQDDRLQVLPAHYLSWDEANEDLIFTAPFGAVKQQNSEIYAIADQASFFQFIKDNMRPQPEEYTMIRRINANLEENIDDDQMETLDLGKNECAASAYAKAQAAKTQTA